VQLSRGGEFPHHSPRNTPLPHPSHHRPPRRSAAGRKAACRPIRQRREGFSIEERLGGVLRRKRSTPQALECNAFSVKTVHLVAFLLPGILHGVADPGGSNCDRRGDPNGVVEHRKTSNIDGKNPGQLLQRLSLPPSPTPSSLIAQRGSVASNASDAHNRPHTKTPAAHTVKCSGSTASPSNPPNTAVPSSSQNPPQLSRETPTKATSNRGQGKLQCLSLFSVNSDRRILLQVEEGVSQTVFAHMMQQGCELELAVLAGSFTHAVQSE